MRITSDLFVSALLRRIFGAGGYGAVVRRGAAEAGAIFVLSRNRLGETRLFGPAAQSTYGEGRPDERFFQALPDMTQDAVEQRLQKESRFDPDIWVVEIEAGSEAVEVLLAIRTP